MIQLLVYQTGEPWGRAVLVLENGEPKEWINLSNQKSWKWGSYDHNSFNSLRSRGRVIEVADAPAEWGLAYLVAGMAVSEGL